MILKRYFAEAVFVLFSVLISRSIADQPVAPIDFVRDVRPILEKHCYECHSDKVQESGFRLDIKESALRGGDNHSPDIVPGNPGESSLLRFISTDDKDQLMPPNGRLSLADIETLKRWIQEGAIWPDGVDRVKLEDKSDHWSFKAFSVDDPNRGIDDFVQHKLDDLSLSMSPPADSVSWLRRVTFDLVGLPPTPEEVADFSNDLARSKCADQPYVQVVEKLLANPRYGERWAQHWLDVVRYADTHGFEVNTERPNAWPYRDYVIRAFNQDTPYNQFVSEQIVGDALDQDAATGFLVTASVLLPGQIGKDAPSIRLARQDSLDEIVNNISQTFLGLSIGCARCHDHKFDPITSNDYYSMQAFVAGVEYEDRDLDSQEAKEQKLELAAFRSRLSIVENQLTQVALPARPGSNRESIPLRPTVGAGPKNTDRFKPIRGQRLRFTIQDTNSLEPCLDEVEIFNTEGINIALADKGTKVLTSGDTIVSDRHMPAFINDGLYGNERSWLGNEVGKGWVEFQFSLEHEITKVLWSRDRQGKLVDRLPVEYRIEVLGDEGWLIVADSSDRRPHVAGVGNGPEFTLEGLTPEDAAVARELLREKSSLEKEIKAAQLGQRAFAGTFRQPDDIHLLNRGDPEQPIAPVPPAVPAVFAQASLPLQLSEQNRRKSLAEWITHPSNPLTARVLVNRIWQWHFGVGLVATPSDFGRSGVAPTHPELLNWLANELIRSGWSIKHMHRVIVLSRTYRQSSEYELSAAEKDADARYLWRFPPRRLEAEAIRDSMLAVSGLLNRQMYGRGFDLFEQRGGLSGFKPIETFQREGLRRMIYAHKVRRERDTVFGAFDCPDGGQSTALRRESTTPIQALNLLNSQFTIDASKALATRVQQAAGHDVTSQIEYCFQLTLGRKASAVECKMAEQSVREFGITPLCRALLNSNEFLFLP